MAHANPVLSRSPRALLLLPLLVGLSGCGRGGEEEAIPDGWRAVRMDHCCSLHVPPSLTTPATQAGGYDPVRRFVRPGLVVALEYGHQVSFPRMRTIQKGWTQERIRVDGYESELVSYDAQERDFSGGRAIHVRVALPQNETFLSPPAPAKGTELGIAILCRTPADCQEGKRIAQTADFPPFKNSG